MLTETAEPEPSPALYETLDKLSRDLRDAARLLDKRAVRYFVDAYYQIQEFRIASAAQVRSAETEEPNRVLTWLFESMRTLEANIKRALDDFSDEYAVGRWMKSIVGIGPVISSGFLAHLDVRGCPTAGKFWRFAGLDPTTRWEKKKKRPWNAKLKVLCFKVGESFIKFQNNARDTYGKIYVARKALEACRNDAGEFRDQAEQALSAKRYRAETVAAQNYREGKLPRAHIHARARRYAVKLFLSHLHHVMYADYYGADPPAPYAFTLAGHGERDQSFIQLPNWPWTGGGKPLRELLVDEPTPTSAATHTE